MMRYVYGFLFTLIFISCSALDIKVLNERDYYSESFLKKIESIQIIYQDGDRRLALKKLDAIADETITVAEQAKKYNLKGVMTYSLGDYDKAIDQFNKAKALVQKDEFLANNIYLNLASSYFKKNELKKVDEYLSSIDPSYLKDKEKQNFHQLAFTSGNQFERNEQVVKSLLYLMRDIKTIKGVEDYKYKEILLGNFKKLSESQRIYLLEEYQKVSPLTVAYLARTEAMARFYKGNHEGAGDIVDWLEKYYSTNSSIFKFVNDYRFRIENYSKINSSAIGLVLPLSGRLSKYGRKAIAGVNTSLADSDSKSTFKIFVKDNANNALLAKKQIKFLATKKNVAVIIGGLFPKLAKEEYLEARKYGVLYISLSPVYIPRAQKNHLLIEVPGSVESQIAEITRPEVLETFGRKGSILYPFSDAGQSYVDELWNIHNQEKINLVNVSDYKKGIFDYRESVKTLLGLKFPRERKEEYEIWSEIKNINKRSVRIVNVLPPVVDFDWIFIPALPNEALQIIPTFGFYDVKKMKFIGGPSWINKKLQREQRNFSGRIYAVGNDTTNIEEEFIQKYRKKNNVNPHLVDTLAYESGQLIQNIIGDDNFSEREDLEKKILDKSKLKGMSFSWNFTKGLWIKKMDLLEVKSNSFIKVI